MNEIVAVKVGYNLGNIQNNLQEVAESVRKYCDDFKGVVVTEETVVDGRQMLANIRKEKKYLDDQRKEIKKAWNAPYLEFEKQVKEVTALYDEPISMINSQIQELEEQRKVKKRETIKEIWASANIPEELTGWFSLSELYDPRRENATFKEKDIEQAIADQIGMLKMSYDTVKSLHHPYEEDGLKVLKESKDLQSAITCMTNLLEQEKRIMEQKRLQEEEEKRRKEEEARLLEEIKNTPVQVATPEPEVEWITFHEPEPVGFTEEVPELKIYEVAMYVCEKDLDALRDILDGAGLVYEVKEV